MESIKRDVLKGAVDAGHILIMLRQLNPKPECVYQYMDKFYRECGGNAGRGNYEQAKSAGELIANTRSMIQDLLHCPTKQVVFEPTATIALNLIIQGNIERGAHNIYVSPFEHNAVTRVLLTSKSRRRLL